MLKFEGKVYLVGMDGFGDELTLLGIPFFGPGVDPIEGDPPDWAKSTLDPEVCALYRVNRLPKGMCALYKRVNPKVMCSLYGVCSRGLTKGMCVF